MKKLNICMVCSEFPPNCAGIGQAVYSLSKELVKQGHKVTVLTRGKLFTKKRTIDGIEVHDVTFLPLPPPLHIKFHGYFINKLLNSLGDFDIIHLHSPLVPKIKSNAPNVLTVHSCWKNEAKVYKKITDFHSLYIKLFQRLFQKIEKDSINNSNEIVTISTSVVSQLKDDYEIKKEIHKVGNSIDIRKFYTLNNLNTNNFEIVYVGRLVYEKGLIDLINSASYVCKKYPSTIFKIIGKGPLENKLKILVKRLNLQRNVLFLGHISNNQLYLHLQKSNTLVIPSYYESFGIVILEAMACGKPIIGTNVGGIPDLVKNGKTGYLVEPKNPKELSKAIIKILDNPKIASKMGKNGREVVENNFTNQIIAKKYELLYGGIKNNN